MPHLELIGAELIGVILAGALTAGFVSGLSGFAFAMVALGFWGHVLPPAVMVPLIVACSTCSQIYSMARLRRTMRLDLALPFILGGLAGIPVGVWLLDWIAPGPFKLAVGLFLIAYGTLMLARGHAPPIRWGGKAADAAIGWIGGVMGGIAGLSGAVPTIWCALRGWSREDQRGTFQPFSLALQAAALISYAIKGLLTEEVGTLFAVSLPAMAIGVGAGLALYHRIDDAQFRRIVLWLLIVSGVLMVIW